MVSWYTLWTILVLVLGVGSFLRIVAKDVHRRERYLILRLEKEEKDREAAAQKRNEALSRQGNAEAEEEAEIVAEVAPEEIVAEKAA